MFIGMPSSSIVPEGIPRIASKTSPLAFEIVGTAQHVGRCERGRIGDRVGGDVQRDALAVLQQSGDAAVFDAEDRPGQAGGGDCEVTRDDRRNDQHQPGGLWQ